MPPMSRLHSIAHRSGRRGQPSTSASASARFGLFGWLVLQLLQVIPRSDCCYWLPGQSYDHFRYPSYLHVIEGQSGTIDPLFNDSFQNSIRNCAH